MTANAWVICPYNAKFPALLQDTWEAGFRGGFIGIGWSKAGDVTGKSREAIQAIIDREYAGQSPKGGSTLWSFMNEILVGDTIVARSGLSQVLGVGRVVRSGFYDPTLCTIGQDVRDPHLLFIMVEWDRSFAPRTMPSTRYFRMGTLHRLSPEKLAEVRGAPPAALASLPVIPPGPLSDGDVERMEESSASPALTQFALEKYLEQFLVDHFQRIFPELVIYSSPDGEDYGQQYVTDIGRLDILAYNPKDRVFIVMELKKGRESDAVVGQVARYMSWVRLNLCREGQTVRGMIICADSDARMRHAVLAIPDLELRHYQIEFRLLIADPAKPTRIG
jgi:hypothetical protein